MMANGGPWDSTRLRRGEAFFSAVKASYLDSFTDRTTQITHRPSARLLVARRPTQGLALGTYRRGELPEGMIAAARRLQQQVFFLDSEPPDPPYTPFPLQCRLQARHRPSC